MHIIKAAVTAHKPQTDHLQAPHFNAPALRTVEQINKSITVVIIIIITITIIIIINLILLFIIFIINYKHFIFSANIVDSSLVENQFRVKIKV